MQSSGSCNAIATPAIAGEITTSRVQYYKNLAAERTRAARPLRLVEYVAVYATTHEIEVETARQYRMSAEKLERWAGGPVYLTDLTELLVSAFLREYGETVKPSTARSKRTQLMALWRSAADEYLCEPPTRRVRSARVPWEPREAWTIDEVRELVRAASWLPRNHSCGMRRAEWFDLAIRIAWDSGLRWGDQVRLRVADVHGDLVVVPQSKTSRPVCGRLTASTLAILRDTLRRHPRALVTPWTKSHETFNDQVRRLVAKAGIRPGTWKWLRRGGATDVEIQAPGKGMAARHLGHAPGSRIAEINYLDHVQIAAAVPMVSPREIGGVA
jgi:integrase